MPMRFPRDCQRSDCLSSPTGVDEFHRNARRPFSQGSTRLLPIQPQRRRMLSAAATSVPGRATWSRYSMDIVEQDAQLAVRRLRRQSILDSGVDVSLRRRARHALVVEDVR